MYYKEELRIRIVNLNKLINCPFVTKLANVTTIYFVTRIFVNPNTGDVYIFSQRNSVFKLEEIDLLVEIKN